jgi:Co/Zn/Cd efflux system component
MVDAPASAILDEEGDSASTLSSDAPSRVLVFRTTVWRDEQQGLELSVRTRGRTRRLAVSVNSQVLISTLLLNATIVGAQFVGAWYANSLALLIDCSSMLVDVISYAAAIWAECSPGGNSELIVSALSMLALWGVTCPAVVGALFVLQEGRRREQVVLQGVADHLATDPASEVNPLVILGFALAGLTCDALALSCFLRRQRSLRAAPRAGKGGWGDRRRSGHARRGAGMLSPVAAEPSLAESDGYGAGSRVVAHVDDADADADGGAASGREHDRDAINMRSALAHVVADSCRSLSTAAAALLILFGGYEPRKTDALCSLVVALFVLVASVGVCKLWCLLAGVDFGRLCGADAARTERRAPPSPSGAAKLGGAPAHEPELGARPALPTPAAGSPSGRFRRGRLVWHEAHGHELGGFRSAAHDGR